MREHMGLFRGKRLDNGEWVEGWLVKPLDGTVLICTIVEGLGCGYCCQVIGDFGNYHVDPTTIGECTSLKDKNGKLIFEHQKFKYEGELYEVRIVCGECRLYDKFDHYCELYKYAGSGEIVSED